MANNTKQADAMVVLKDNLDAMFSDREDVFVAIDLFWYPVKGHPEIVQAPDVMVALGRPKGHRMSYKQWHEENTPPQVVFEVLSDSNTPAEMAEKLAFYERYGVQEYYIYDPDTGRWQGYLRRNDRLVPIEQMVGWVSPLLGIRFELGYQGDPGVYDPEGNRFRPFTLVRRDLQDAIAREEQARLQAQRARFEAEQARRRAEAERKRAKRLEEKLRELGINPDELD